MKTKHIIIIIIVITIILLLVSVLIFIKYKDNNINNITQYDISNNLFQKTIYVNTDGYNNIYNLNYQGNKLYKNKDFILDSFLSSSATVITDPEIKEIYVNNVKVNLYVATIKYDINNYVSDKITIKPDYMEKRRKLPENKSTVAFTFDKNSIPTGSNPTNSNTTSCEVEIVVTRQIRKGDTITVFYKYGSTNQDRVIPPFFLEHYITYFT
jgi:hypothetical protein